MDLRGADLRGVDLQNLPLSRMLGGLTPHEWDNATPEQREMASVHLEGGEFILMTLFYVQHILRKPISIGRIWEEQAWVQHILRELVFTGDV